ncbi:hypothetical protein ANANG_G00062060 [Anguilla anguilla]|uniref:FHF complex subunit HOOK-interacting protein 1B n=1 Tax=Anguilla anguilla TaxID=7936 RepID=A0A9D3S2L9_ANGAN|nr:hypothetical protein ANANG_G00062060 [Anguilla anguilla]
MMCLLAEERPGRGRAGDAAAMGPILELAVTENILDRLLQWHLRRGLDPDSQGALLKLFEMLIGRSQQALLRHKPVLQPLLRLLAACADPQLGCPRRWRAAWCCCSTRCARAWPASPPCWSCCSAPAPPQPRPGPQGPAPIPQGPTNLLIFSLLVPFIHRDGAIGQQARDALLLVMATSADNQAMARYIAENSYFCPVLATGLSALYSSLPRKIEVRGDDWHALRREDWVGVSSLVLFMNSLEFCNAVVQVSHPLVRGQLLDYVHNGFLVPVMGPALHKSSVEEMIASTAYLDLFLRSVTETALLKTFLRFILLHRHDNDTILNTLLARISSNSRLCMVSLSLFRTLLALNCEDLMLQLVLRYLIPCTHVMLSQRRAVKETDIYGKSADRFLSLIPECCRLDTAPSSDREDDPAFWDKVPGSPTAESPVHPKPSTPSRLVLFIRQQSSGGGVSPPSGSETTPASPRGGPSPLSPDSPVHPAPEAGSWRRGTWPTCGTRAGHRALLLGLPRLLPHPAAGPQGPQAAALYNGAGQGGPCPDVQEAESEVKKVKRDSGGDPPPGEAGLNGGVVGGPGRPARVWGEAAGLGGSGGQGQPAPPLPNASEAPEPARNQIRLRTRGWDLRSRQRRAWGWRHQHRAFHQELRELEDRVRERRGRRTPPPGTPCPHPRPRPRPRHPTRTTAPSPPDSDLSAAEPKAESSAPGVLSPAHPLTQPASQPYTGPFMAVLFAKLECMLQNSLYVNILLTGILAQLACYPQPLLRSFLLNTNMVFQPSVKSLIQVLGSVKNRIEAFAATQEDFPAMLRKARRYLTARGKLDWGDSPVGVPNLRRSDSLVKSRKPSLGDLLLRHTQSPTRARQAAQLALAHVRDGSQSLHSALFRGGAGGGASGVEKQAEALRVKNAVYSAVVFSEFLKELAALAQEHAVAMPFPRSQGAEE